MVIILPLFEKYLPMSHFTLKVSVLLLFACPLTLIADSSATVEPIVNNGMLQYVTVRINSITFKINSQGKITRIQQAVNKSHTAAPHVRYTAPNFLSNQGKTLAAVGDIPVRYYPCEGALDTLNPAFVQQHSAMIVTSAATQQMQNNLKKIFSSGNCVNGSGGKVQQIGDIQFTYYDSLANSSINNFNTLSGSQGKIKSVGPYHITYYPLDTFGNKGGKIQYINKSG